MSAAPLRRLRRLCLALPEAHEVEAWGEPTFQQLMIQASPERFFVPPDVGPGGWVGVWLDRVVDWKNLAELLRYAYALVAPKRLRSELETQSR